MAIAALLALNPQSSWVFTAVLLTLTAIALLLFGFTPTATRIAGGQLQVASPLRTWTIPLESIVRADPATLNPWITVRISAIGFAAAPQRLALEPHVRPISSPRQQPPRPVHAPSARRLPRARLPRRRQFAYEPDYLPGNALERAAAILGSRLNQTPW